MNQQAPLRTPQRPESQVREPEVTKKASTSFSRLVLILTAVGLALAIVATVLVLVMLPTMDRDNPLYDGGGDKPSVEEGGENPSSSGAVSTSPSRSDYAIKNSSDFRGIEDVPTKYAILVDLNSYEAIAGKNADVRICPASMTKVMTVLVVCENLTSLDDRLVITAEVLNDSLKGGGSGLKDLWIEGNEFSVEDLLYLAFMQSDTVACKLLAEYIAGSEEAFTKMMNAKAKEIGMDDTVFSNSTGLSIKGETYYSTCRDVAMMMAYALDNSLANRILTATDRVLKKGYAPINERTTIKPTWLTERLGSAALDTVTVKGGKTGYETEPGYCLVSSAVSNSGDGEYILVTVGGSGVKLAQTIKDVKSIYNTYAD